MKALSPTQQRALDLAGKKGTLYRYPGGHWAPKGFKLSKDLSHLDRQVGVATVQNLVDRGIMRFVQYQVPRRGGPKFPVRAEKVAQNTP